MAQIMGIRCEDFVFLSEQEREDTVSNANQQFAIMECVMKLECDPTQALPIVRRIAPLQASELWQMANSLLP
jgi:hypothetical protein